MPIKVHVKGKRKAPLPPTKSPERVSVETAPSNSNENVSSLPSNGNELKARKKLAPTPPRDEIDANNSPSTEDQLYPSNMSSTPNNLSGCASPGKFARKKYEGNIFFNIIGASISSDKCSGKEFVHSNKIEKGEPVLKNYRSNLDLFEEIRETKEKDETVKLHDEDENNLEKVVHRNLLVWNCQYCTLENPFWKIVCAVCDNMKPYDLPTTSTQTEALNLETKPDHCDEKDQAHESFSTNSRKIDSSASQNGDAKYENAYDEIYSTNGNENVVEPEIQADAQPYAVDVVYRKKVNNKDVDNAIKRNSEIIIKDYAMNTLEMEKQRLRAVIRSMNNRALAEKYPIQTRNAVSLNNGSRKTPEYEVIDDFVGEAINTGAIRKTDVKNNVERVDVKNNFEKVEVKNNTILLNNNIQRVEVSSPVFTATKSIIPNLQLASEKEGTNKIIEIIPPQPVYWNRSGTNIEANPPVLDVREKNTKVSTSAQTDTFVKALPGTSGLSNSSKPEIKPEIKPELNPTPINLGHPCSSKDVPPAENSKSPFATLDLPDACYEYIGNLSMYGDQDVFTNTLKKLENAFSDRKTEATFVEMNVSNLKLSVNVPKATPPEESILVNLYINFNNAIQIDVQPSMLLSELKNKIALEVIPSIEQRIYFNGLLMDKEKTLKEYGIKEKSSIYLNTEDVKVGIEAGNANIIPYVGDGMKFIKNDLASNSAKSDNYNRDYQNKPGTSSQTQAEVLTKSPVAVQNGEKAAVEFDQYRIEHTQMNRISIEKVNDTPGNPNITKTKYRGVYNYNPRYNPTLVIEGEPFLIRIKEESKKAEEIPEVKKRIRDLSEPKGSRQSHYLELLTLDNLNDIATNTEPFDCAICIMSFEVGEGVVLRDCLHTFCKDCIRNTIVYSEEAEVKCPYIDDTYTCESVLQDREVKAILTKEEHDDHLAKSLRVAEHKIQNSFHCRTPNCKGWCIYEDNVNQFKCPICSLINCLTCRVIHDGLNCKQYQENAKNEEGNPDNNTTRKMLEEMVENGEAMFCPTCRVVLMKKWGCDWLKCSMCKTEICWVTRGSRWGPAGKGDTSGGCKCGVNGVKCHPKCNYCH